MGDMVPGQGEAWRNGARAPGYPRGMVTFRAASKAPPALAWALYARPRAWPAWAPQLRGAWGLAGDDGEVEEGRIGAARLLGVVPVPARISAKDPGRSWTWQV